MGNAQKNIQLIVVLLKALFLILHLSNYTLMTFLMVLSVIFLSMLMILPSTLGVIRYLICGNSSCSLLKSILTYETLLTWAGSGFLTPMLEKLDLLRLTDLITLVLLM